MSTNKKYLKKVLIIAVIADVLILAMIIFIFRLYPVAMVGNNIIWNRKRENSIAIAKRFESIPDKSKVFVRLLENSQKEQLLSSLNVARNVTMDEEKDFYRTQNEEYTELLNNYFSGDEKLLEDYVIKPQVYDVLLRIKYNSDFGANNAAYNRAENILSRLNSGSSFEELAKTMSDDKITGQLGGDLGFAAKNEVIPEIQRALANSVMGEVKKQIVVSRYGYHILYPVEVSERNGVPVTHLKHILIQTQGYDSWLQNQLQSIKVRKFMKL